MRPLRLYYRSGCHLCEEMRKQLNGSRWHGKFSLELIDVDSAATELFSYQARIPVLETPQGKCLSEYFLDEDALLSYLDGG